jgi:molybdopterin-containing oxidoreductase family membrane subunit
MVLLLAVPCRAWFGLKDVITPAAPREHVQDPARDRDDGRLRLRDRVLHLVVQRESAEGFVFINRAFGPYAWAYWTMVFCNVVTPQVFWSRRARSNPLVIFGVAAAVNVGHVVRALRHHRDDAVARFPALELELLHARPGSRC